MDVEGKNFIIRTKDAVYDRNVIGSILESKIEKKFHFQFIRPLTKHWLFSITFSVD